ncbi:PorV/PorQ family protein [candidate division WOR-3 bacterium]|nr:PorV/PorQ family protein [candidate division WOR-3 bacterium]
MTGLLLLVALLRTAGEPAWGSVQVLSLDFGARASGMGGAYISLSDGVNSLFYNPAGLSRISFIETSFSHQEWFAGFRDGYGAVGMRTPYGVFALGGLYSGVSGIEGYMAGNEPMGEFNLREAFIIFAGYGRELPLNFSAGGVLKGVFHNLDPNIGGLQGDKGSAVCLDLGLIWGKERFGLGLALRNYGTDVKYRGGTNPLLSEKRLGGFFHVTDRLLLSSDLILPSFGDTYLSLGGEVYLAPFLPVRVGYRTGPGEGGFINSISFGFGVRWRMVEIDYAYVPYELGHTHRLSIGYTLERPVGEYGNTGSYNNETDEEIEDLF